MRSIVRLWGSLTIVLLLAFSSLAVLLGQTSASAQTSSENSDRAALVALYDATDGPNWTNSANWLTDAPLGEWYGVTADDDGRVLRLQLQGNRLAGEIPPELGSLSKLDELSLSGNELSGTIPAELGDLSNLWTLRLFDDELSGEIPSVLGSLSNLRGLRLDDNKLSGEIPAELGNLSSLVLLHLSNNELTGTIPADLGNLASLVPSQHSYGKDRVGVACHGRHVW